ncbi:type 1 glutamine amidotransferase [Saccharopolyspora sp. HNM0983]|uniref:Type 1 glutamine amidotransferase n=1 Tax=Saccharopolyspora montiporae TaxID=2781240 RepID=A0A929G0X5_9PSEU|nr:type 1 glutamine amidotransferase domain-containing protein [Saccharopolyspora sp. HNM0983]MBE9375247.1 type 1 glutamine amidotransferase [Saccharopolyspora sp. HNM0983]
MTADITGRAVAFLVAPEGIEQVELTEPWTAVEQAGGDPVLVSTQSGRVQGFHHLDKADTFPVDAVVGETGADSYDALVLPGGVANPDYLRTVGDAVRFTHAFFEQGKPVAAICHAPWLLVEADVVRGRTVTSFPSVRTDLVNAGAEWVDREVVTDRGLVTSRTPKDLAAFNAKLVEEIAEGEHRAQARSAERVSAGPAGGHSRK